MKDSKVLRLKTDSPDEFMEWIFPAVGAVRAQVREESIIISDLAQFGRMNFFSTGANKKFRIDILDERQGVATTVPLGKGFQANISGRFEQFSGEEAHLLAPIDSLKYCASGNNLCLVLNIENSVFTNYAKKLFPDKHPDISQNSRLNLSGEYGRSFQRIIRLLWNELHQGGGLLKNQLFSKELEEVAINAHLLAIDENFKRAEKIKTADCPTAIRKVEEYLLANLTEPHSLAELSELAQIPVRSLLRGFKKVHGISPMQFLHTRRLEAVFIELGAQSPQNHTVTQTALKYGFGNLGRFAADYQKKFGELPSETLKRSL